MTQNLDKKIVEVILKEITAALAPIYANHGLKQTKATARYDASGFSFKREVVIAARAEEVTERTARMNVSCYTFLRYGEVLTALYDSKKTATVVDAKRNGTLVVTLNTKPGRYVLRAAHLPMWKTAEGILASDTSALLDSAERAEKKRAEGVKA